MILFKCGSFLPLRVFVHGILLLTQLFCASSSFITHLGDELDSFFRATVPSLILTWSNGRALVHALNDSEPKHRVHV